MSRYTHGGRYGPIYNVWRAMKRRCYDPKAAGFAIYGGRGITVCDEWRSSFAAFRDHIGDRPSMSHTIDRIDSDKGYEPGNVRWATKSEQQWNRKTLPHITIDGVSLTMAEWAARAGLRREVVRGRVRMGWKGSRILSPVRK